MKGIFIKFSFQISLKITFFGLFEFKKIKTLSQRRGAAVRLDHEKEVSMANGDTGIKRSLVAYPLPTLQKSVKGRCDHIFSR